MKPKVQFTALIILLLPQIGHIAGVILKNVTIPRYGVKDGTVELGCEFTLGSDTLFSLQWYKSDQEFFRYKDYPERHILTFPVDGVFVDLSKSSLHKVVLKNITLQTSGVYRCEISVEHSFKTLSKQGAMVIIAPPRSEPYITGVHSVVNIGDRIKGNCTSSRSKPAAALTFYINDEKPEIPEVIKYSLIREPDELETSIIGFNFIVENRHFHNGTLRLKCTATIGNFYWIKIQNISDANIKAQLSFPGHNRLASGTKNSMDFSNILLYSIFMSGIFTWLANTNFL